MMAIIFIITINILSNALSMLITFDARNGVGLRIEGHDAATLARRRRRPKGAVDDAAVRVAMVDDPLWRNVGRDVADEHLDTSKTIN